MTWYKPKQKYGNQRAACIVGHSHRSRLESSVCGLISARKDWQLVNAEDSIYLTKARILYIADFKVKDLETDEIFHVESKGYNTDVWAIKRRLWVWYGPNKLLIFKGTHLRPYLDETIIPKDDHEDL